MNDQEGVGEVGQIEGWNRELKCPHTGMEVWKYVSKVIVVYVKFNLHTYSLMIPNWYCVDATGSYYLTGTNQQGYATFVEAKEAAEKQVQKMMIILCENYFPKEIRHPL